MSDRFPPAQQRRALLEFASALGSSLTALRRDNCGDWRIMGARGWIYATPQGFQIAVMPGGEHRDTPSNSKEWTYVKREMGGFTTVQNDSDGEGTLLMARHPTPAEAATIRAKLGIRKSPDLCDTARAARAERLLVIRPQAAPETPSDGAPATPVAGRSS